MSAASPNFEEAEFKLWEEMRRHDVKQLHEELKSLDDSRRLAAAKELQIRGEGDTFSYAVELTKAADASLREIAAFILGQLGTPSRPFLRQSILVLSDLLEQDEASKVRAAAAAALGHLASNESLESLTRASEDKAPDVRMNVAFALGKISDERSISTLLLLTRDPNADTISWAVVGLRLLMADSSAVRDRLAELLSDSREDILDEAIFALAGWHDVRVFPALMAALHRENINFDLIEAAGNLGDIRALPRLRSLLEEWKDDPPAVLYAAINKLESKVIEER